MRHWLPWVVVCELVGVQAAAAAAQTQGAAAACMADSRAAAAAAETERLREDLAGARSACAAAEAVAAEARSESERLAQVLPSSVAVPGATRCVCAARVSKYGCTAASVGSWPPLASWATAISEPHAMLRQPWLPCSGRSTRAGVPVAAVETSRSDL